MHVTLLGMIILCVYLALYFGVFALVVRTMQYAPRPRSGQARRITILIIPATWVALEYLRTNFATGFGWLLLGYSQSKNLPMIQIADSTGPYGVSFLIVMVNVVLYQVISDCVIKRSKRPVTQSLFIVFLCLAVTLGYGYFQLNQDVVGETLTISVIQGNIPQEKKWDKQYEKYIFDRYEILTKVASTDKPEIVIWPETAFPGYFGDEEKLTKRMKRLVREIKIPILFGTPLIQTRDEGRGTKDAKRNTQYAIRTTNSALLLDASGSVLHQYDKLHLVPFGEYVPFERIFGFVHNIAPAPIADFTPGTDYTIFKIPPVHRKPPASPQPRQGGYTANRTFGVLICFEDIFPHLVRRFVREGAVLMVNITNDAWFKETAAPYQHAQASVFRAIENRVPVVRAANTGFSCFIDAHGRLVSKVQDRAGNDIFVEGYETRSVTVHPAKTLYTRCGDVFAYACIIFWLLSLAAGRPPNA
jgi:apolipoprotein N-acyltransferase